MRRFGFVIGVFVLVVVSYGCSGSSEVRDSSTEAGTLVPYAENVILFDDRGLISYQTGEATSETLEPGVQFGGETWPGPNLFWTALTVKKGESTYLALVGSNGAYRELHGPATAAEYSAVWAPTGDSLLFGFRSVDQSGVSVFSTGSRQTRDVGCSVSDIALSWGQQDWFIVGDGTNHYVVERGNCGTIESIDARKRHEVVFGPVGKRVAYILRELEYDRQDREYRPDSSLYIADAVGTHPVLIAGDRYRPHRPSWRRDGLLLAFDARLLDEPDRRLISIYDVADARSTFLNPEAVDSKLSEWNPKWSPSGGAIAYLQSSNGGQPLVAVRRMSSSFTTTVGAAGERFAGWLDDSRLILRGNGRTRVVGLDGRESAAFDASTAIVSLGDSGSRGSN